MDDLARLRIDLRVVLPRLELRQYAERVVREFGAEEECLEARNERVAAEDGHEPGHPGSRKLAGHARVFVHPKRCEVGNGLVEGIRELLPRRAQLRNAEFPGRERVAYAGELVTEAPLGARRRSPKPVGGGDDVDAQTPRLARLQGNAIANCAALHLSRLREQDLRQANGVVGKDELVRVGLERRLHELGQRRRVLRIPEGEVVRLDREDVSEVAPHLERELELDPARGVVVHDDALLHAVANEAIPSDRDLVRAQPRHDRIAQEEGCREVLHPVGGERQRAGAVDRQYPPGEEAGVVREETHDGVGDVAAVVRDAEGRPLENR